MQDEREPASHQKREARCSRRRGPEMQRPEGESCVSGDLTGGYHVLSMGGEVLMEKKAHPLGNSKPISNKESQ